MTRLERDLSNMLSFFKALSDESRLKIVGILASGDRSVEELASLLELRAPTVSHHLSRLKKTGLVHMSTEGNTHIYSLNVDSLRTLSKQILSVEKLSADDLVDSEAWEKKVMNDFFEDSRLKVIPASRKKREVILRFLAEQFDRKQKYSEKEVNQIIGRYHEDFATLRRELVGAALMKRKAGEYWRVK